MDIKRVDLIQQLELRVKHPEYDEEDDDSLLNDIFGSAQSSGDM